MATGTMAGSHYAREGDVAEGRTRSEKGDKKEQRRGREEKRAVEDRRCFAEQRRIALFRQRLPLVTISFHFSSCQENLALERKSPNTCPTLSRNSKYRRRRWIVSVIQTATRSLLTVKPDRDLCKVCWISVSPL